jgi:hypothetical protein
MGVLFIIHVLRRDMVVVQNFNKNHNNFPTN